MLCSLDPLDADLFYYIKIFNYFIPPFILHKPLVIIWLIICICNKICTFKTLYYIVAIRRWLYFENKALYIYKYHYENRFYRVEKDEIFFSLIKSGLKWLIYTFTAVLKQLVVLTSTDILLTLSYQ